MFNVSSKTGFSLVSTIIGLGFIVGAAYYFKFAYTDSLKSTSKLEKTAFGKNFLTIQALTLQSFTFENLLLATEASPYNCDSNPRPSSVAQGGVLSLLRTWGKADANTDYCIDIKNFELKENDRVLDINLVGYFKSNLVTKTPSNYSITFRKSK